MDLLGALDFFGVKKLSSDCIVAKAGFRAMVSGILRECSSEFWDFFAF